MQPEGGGDQCDPVGGSSWLRPEHPRRGAAGVAADVVAAWHGHTERMTQVVYGRVTDDRLTAASAVFAPRAIGQSQDT